MTIKCGIVGLPNVGKSTLFNAMTRSSIAESSNYPFCTIEPNVAVIPVPDLRLDVLSTLVKPQKTIPAVVELVDIAGLIKGASKGDGLGNQFLANIRETQAILHVVRCFNDPNIIHVHDQINPAADIEVIDIELCLADLMSLEKIIAKQRKFSPIFADKEWGHQLTYICQKLNEGIPIRSQNLGSEVLNNLKPYQLLTQKPVLYCTNVDENSGSSSEYVKKVQEIANLQGSEVVTLCTTLEHELSCLSEEEALMYLQEMGLQEAGLNQLIRKVFSLLNLQSFFTVGEKEVRAWVTPKGTEAPEAAGVIHTDFTKHFIRAEVVSYEDFVAYKNWALARAAGKTRLEGKTYKVCDGDIIIFRTSA